MSAVGGEAVENMDKKNHNRPSSGVADSKKSDNGSFNKNTKHGGRRREGAASFPKRDQGNHRRPAPQKSGGLDKRPRARTSGPGRKREEVMEVRAEVGSALRYGNKKTNLNHLLNFTYEPRGQATSGGDGHPRSSGWKRRNFWSGRSSTRFSKEQFLQANCQFVVRGGRDYSVHAADPDTLVDWDLIEQVRITSHEVPSCPICLYPPTAAKITRCGHIYCWACMLHYLSLGDKPWRKCPICYDEVEPKDLKSVVALETHAYSAGETISLKLMRRERGSTYTLPVSQWTPYSGKPHNIEDDVDVCYAKLLVARSDQVQRIVDAEYAALEGAKEEEGDTFDGTFIKAALERLQDRAELLHYSSLKSVEDKIEALNVSSEESSDSSIPSPTCVTPPMNNGAKKIVYSSAFSDEEEPESVDAADSTDPGAQNVEESTVEDPDEASVKEEQASVKEEQASDTEDKPGDDTPLASGDSPQVEAAKASVVSAENAEMTGDSPPKKTPNKITTEYYFYQAEDGQHIYLHSINARCLVHTYGSWEKCPQTITARIIEMDAHSLTQDIRSRLRYLSHLPLTCEFQVAELELQPPVVSEESLKVFKVDIEKRKRNRRKKDRDDKRLMRKMEADERKKLGMGPGLRVSLENTHHFPQYTAEASGHDDYPSGMDIECPSTSTISSERTTPVHTPVGSPVIGGLNPNAAIFVPGSEKPRGQTVTAEEGEQSGGMSFAQMLQSGKAKPMEAWARTGSSRGKVATKMDSAHRPRTISQGSEDGDPEDRIPVPIFQTSFGDAIEEALNRHAMMKGGSEAQEGAVGCEVAAETKGKKKKKVKKLLFTTSMARTK